MNFVHLLSMIFGLISLIILLPTNSLGKGRIMESYTVHYGIRDGQKSIEEGQSFECGTIDINGSHIRFLRGHPSSMILQEYEPEHFGPIHKSWDILFKIICRKIRGISSP